VNIDGDEQLEIVILEKGKKAVYKNPAEFGYESIDVWLSQEITYEYGHCED
jgi:hypothetical protein